MPHLLRLAETSPHLLADVGLDCDKRPSGVEHWRGFGRTIVVETTSGRRHLRLRG